MRTLLHLQACEPPSVLNDGSCSTPERMTGVLETTSHEATPQHCSTKTYNICHSKIRDMFWYVDTLRLLPSRPDGAPTYQLVKILTIEALAE
jgi:hypothetical protein